LSSLPVYEDNTPSGLRTSTNDTLLPVPMASSVPPAPPTLIEVQGAPIRTQNAWDCAAVSQHRTVLSIPAESTTDGRYG